MYFRIVTKKNKMLSLLNRIVHHTFTKLRTKIIYQAFFKARLVYGLGTDTYWP